MSFTTDPKDPDLGHGADDKRVPMNKKYLVLSDEERAKGFVRPLRYSYKHVGIAGPAHPTRDLTDRERELYGEHGFIKFEPYPHSSSSAMGRFWTKDQLDQVGKGCGSITTMGRPLAETYARQPGFYGATYCCACEKHRPVGADGEFVWDGTDERVGT